MSSIVTDKQRKRLLERPSDGSPENVMKDRRLNDFYARKALSRWLDSIEDIDLILDKLPPEQLDRNEILKADMVLGLFKIVEKLSKMLDPPQVRQKVVSNKIVGYSAIKSFQLGPVDEDGKSVGYSVVRDLTNEEKTLVNGISCHTRNLGDLITPHRVALDCTYEDFLTKKLPALIEEAKGNGLKYQVTMDNLDLVTPREVQLNEILNVAGLVKEGRI